MRRIRRSRAARDDFRDIFLYVGAQDEAAAEALLRRFDQKLELIVQVPGMGRLREDLQPGVRSFAVGQYVLFYRELRDGIELLRVLHGGRDVKKIFRRRTKP